MAYRGVTASQLAHHLGMSRQRFSERMNGRSKFTLDEVATMATALAVSPAVWFDEPEHALTHVDGGPFTGLRGEARSRCSSTESGLSWPTVALPGISSLIHATPNLVSLGA